MRLAHLTISHHHLDVRIFYKEARTAAAAGHEVHVLAPGEPPADRDGIRFHALPEGVGQYTALFWRVLRHYPAILRAARSVDADVIQVPDPILIPAAFLLRRRGARVVYDAHEDRPRQAITKYRTAGRPIVALVSAPLWWALEAFGRRFIDRFVAATPAIASKFPPERTLLLLNYVLRDEIAPAAARTRRNVAVYAGSLNSHRNIEALVEAIGLVPAELSPRLLLLGEFGRAEPGFRARLEQIPGWDRTEYGGDVPRPELAERLGSCRVALNVLEGRPEHRFALGNKMFEYMAAGLPQVYSDFPLWRRVIGGPGLGVPVDPSDPVAIAAALRQLFERPGEAEAMGRRAREAVEERYNWESQEARLLEFYEGLEERESAPQVPLPLHGLRP